VRPADVRALKDDVAPKLAQLQSAARDFSAQAKQATQESVKTAQASLAIVREGMRSVPAVPAPSMAAASAAVDQAAKPPTVPTAIAPVALPPVKNPWAQGVPKALRALRKSLAKGEVGNDHSVTALRRYNQAHDDDVRGHLLLARLYLNREWRSDALNQLSLALQLDPASRGAPEMLPALLLLVAQGAVASDASALITHAYGREALGPIDRALAQPQAEAQATQRLQALRDRLVP
jgi:hypothetical protein